MLTRITNNCNWMTRDVFTLSWAPVSIFVCCPHAFLLSLPWETPASQVQLHDLVGLPAIVLGPLPTRIAMLLLSLANYLALSFNLSKRGVDCAFDPQEAHCDSSLGFISLLLMGPLSNFAFINVN